MGVESWKNWCGIKFNYISITAKLKSAEISYFRQFHAYGTILWCQVEVHQMFELYSSNYLSVGDGQCPLYMYIITPFTLGL